MSIDEIIEIIEKIDVELEKNKKFGAYIPTTQLLIDNRNMLIDMLYRVYGIVYV